MGVGEGGGAEEGAEAGVSLSVHNGEVMFRT